MRVLRIRVKAARDIHLPGVYTQQVLYIPVARLIRSNSDRADARIFLRAVCVSIYTFGNFCGTAVWKMNLFSARIRAVGRLFIPPLNHEY